MFVWFTFSEEIILESYIIMYSVIFMFYPFSISICNRNNRFTTPCFQPLVKIYLNYFRKKNILKLHPLNIKFNHFLFNGNTYFKFKLINLSQTFCVIKIYKQIKTKENEWKKQTKHRKKAFKFYTETHLKCSGVCIYVCKFGRPKQKLQNHHFIFSQQQHHSRPNH